MILTCPPHEPEILAIIHSKTKATVEPEKPSNNPTFLPITYLQSPSGSRTPSSSSPKKKRRYYNKNLDMNSSLIGMYSPKDYYNAALRDYTNWCARKYGDDEFTEAFPIIAKA